MKKTMFIMLMAAGCTACAQREESRVSIIRWTNPEEIVAVETIHADWLAGRVSGNDFPDPFHVLNAASNWHPFVVSQELSDAVVSRAAKRIIDPLKMRRNGRLLVGPQMGWAQAVPVAAGRRILVDVKQEAGCSIDVLLVPIASMTELPAEYRPGTLRTLFERFGSGNIRLEPTPDGKGYSRIISLPPDTRMLLFLVTNPGGDLALFDTASFHYVTPLIEFLHRRSLASVEHPVLLEKACLEDTVRPSILLPPPSRVTFKPVDIREDAVFCCALGASGDFAAPVHVALEVRGRDGDWREVFSETVSPGHRGWADVEWDLKEFEGRRVEFSLTSEYADPGVDPPALLCVGAPILRFKRSDEPAENFNLILISLDTLRSDHLGCYGYPRSVSPNIDALAEEGILFENLYAQAPYTLPSHVSLFTSLYPPSHGVISFRDRIPEGLTLMAETLASHGLECASFNNGGFLSSEYGFHRGFDLHCEVDPLGDRSFDGSVGSFSRALSWLKERKDRRFFLFLHTFMVHDYLPPADLAAEFNVDYTGDLQPGHQALEWINAGRASEVKLRHEDLPFFINMYDATIKAADGMIGDLTAFLDETGLGENTIVVVTSDHGEEFLEHGGVRHTSTVYEELIRVPLILRVPGGPSAVRVENVVNQVDIMPSLFDLMKIETRSEVQGASFTDMFSGKTSTNHVVFSSVDEPGMTSRLCIIQGGLKYIEGDVDESIRYPAPAAAELYRLADDPKERRNLKGIEPDIVESFEKRARKMSEMFHKFHETVQREDGGVSEELLELLKQQGYL